VTAEKGKKQPKGKKPGAKPEGLEIDFGLGKVGISLGGLFKGLDQLMGLASKLQEAGGKIAEQGEIDLSHLKKGMKGVYGFSVRTLVGGEPVVETFGNIKKTPKGPVVEEVREPLVDLFDEEKRIHVVAELPGVEESDIKTELKGDVLTLSSETKDRKYSKEILLPAKVKPESLKCTYKSGILEIELEKE